MPLPVLPAVCAGSERGRDTGCFLRNVQICGSSRSCSLLPALPLCEELELCCDGWRCARDARVRPGILLGPGPGTRACWGSLGRVDFSETGCAFEMRALCLADFFATALLGNFIRA